MSLDLYLFPEYAKVRLEKIGVNLKDGSCLIIDLLRPETNPVDLVSALTTIKSLEIPAALEPAKQLVFHRVPQVRTGGLATTANILKTEGSEFYADVLSHPHFREKHTAILIIRKYGNELCVPQMIKRLRQIMSNRKGTPYLTNTGESELTHCVDFLGRFTQRKDVVSVFSRLIDKWDMLRPEEANWISRHIPYFNHPDLKKSEQGGSAKPLPPSAPEAG